MPVTKRPTSKIEVDSTSFMIYADTSQSNAVNQIEDLIRNHYLDKFIDGSFPIIDQQYMMEDNFGEIAHKHHVVQVITGGTTLVSDSNRANKNYRRY